MKEKIMPAYEVLLSKAARKQLAELPAFIIRSSKSFPIYLLHHAQTCAKN